jgi:leucyl-tRNA synthetase
MISALMEFVNALSERQNRAAWHTAAYHQSLESLLILLAPVAPFIADQLWRLTGHEGSVHSQPWPIWDPALAQDELAQVAVQVNGKLREVIEVDRAAPQTDVEALALGLPKVQQAIAGSELVRTVYVPGRILNIVARSRH